MRKKPQKPYKDFPLTAHNNGQWCKKIKGKIHFFGVWNDPDSAVEKYLEELPYLRLGKKPPTVFQALSVEELCSIFLNSKQKLLEAEELAQVTWNEYKRVTDIFCQMAGKHTPLEILTPFDFEEMRASIAEGRSLVTRGNVIRQIRIICKFAYDFKLVEKPIEVGPSFKPPTKKALRQHRQSKPKKLFSRNQIHAILDCCSDQLKAMTLLGINCGFGNTDVSSLPSNLDLSKGWINYPRPKTSIERRCNLWAETLAALNKVERGKSYLFETCNGNQWVRTRSSGSHVDSISSEFKKVLKAVGITQSRLNFYGLRHTFETIAGRSKDQVAVNTVMGHSDGSMAELYIEEVGNDRIELVTDTVRDWLFGTDCSNAI